MKDANNVPKLRFPEFKGSWERQKLGDVFEQTSFFVNPRIRNIELWSLTVEDGLTPKSERYNREFLVKKDDIFKEVRPGDIVYNPMNMTLGAVGYNGMEKSVAVSGYYVTMFAKENYDTYFINTWLKSPQAIQLYKIHATGTLIEKQRVQFPTLSIISVVFPDYKEQKKIGYLFEIIDNLIALHQRKCDKLKEYKKGCLQKMFPRGDAYVPEVRFPGFTGAWERRKLGDVVRIYDGTHQTPKYQDHGVMFVSVEDIQTLVSEKFISEEDYQKNYSVVPERGDILMTRIGDIGTASIVKSDEPLAYYVSLALLKNTHLDAGFLKANITAPSFQKELWIRTLHTAYPKKINKDEIGYCMICIPSNKDEQAKIGVFFDNLDNLIALQKRECEKYKELKKGLLQQMFV